MKNAKHSPPGGSVPRVLAGFFVVALALAACQASTQPVEGTSGPEPTEAPESPDTTTAANEDGEGIPPEAIWIGLGILLVFLFIGFFMGRSGKTTSPQPSEETPEVTPKDGSEETPENE